MMLLFAACSPSCSAEDDQGREVVHLPADDPETESCPCAPTGELSWGVEVDLECFCANWGCPDSIADILEPEPFFPRTTWVCSDGYLVSRSNGFAADAFMFDKDRATFLGARASYDYPTACGVNQVQGGELTNDVASCEQCILSHGVEFIAKTGECLDEDTLPTDFSSGGGASGMAGASQMGMGGFLR